MSKDEYFSEDALTGQTDKGIVKVIHYPFDRYVITVRLSSNNEFIDITKIKINKDFLEGRKRLEAIRSVEIEPE